MDQRNDYIVFSYGSYVESKALFNSLRSDVSVQHCSEYKASAKTHLFEEYLKLNDSFTRDLDPMKIIHPTYGLVFKVLKAVEDKQKKQAMQDYMDVDDEYMKLAKKEAEAACSSFPRQGLLTNVVSFEAYIHNVLQIFADLLIQNSSITDFIEICGEDSVFDKVFRQKLTNLFEDNSETDVFHTCGIVSCLSLAEFQMAWELIPPSLRYDKQTLTVDVIAHKARLLFEEFVRKENAEDFSSHAYVRKSFRAEVSKCIGKLSSSTLTAIIETLKGIFLGDANLQAGCERALDECIASEQDVRCVRLKIEGKVMRIDNEDIEQHVGGVEQPTEDLTLHYIMWRKQQTLELSEDHLTKIKHHYKRLDGFWLFNNNDFEFLVRPADRKTADDLSRLFNGLCCLVSHGSATKTLADKGALGNKPEQLALEVVKKRKRVRKNNHDYFILSSERDRIDAAAECENYFLTLWQRAIDERKEIQIDYWLCCTCQNFYLWLGRCLERTLACILHKLISPDKLPNERKESWSSLNCQERQQVCERFEFPSRKRQNTRRVT